MAQYSGLAAIYDQLMQGIDYRDWASYITRLIAAHGGVPLKKALDLACGTGNTSLALAQEGFDVTGLDLSGEMLSLAQKKTGGLPVTYIEEDMRLFALPSQVGLVVSFQDGINYLLTPADFEQTVAAVYRSLLPGGLFIFDINRVEKLKGMKSDVSWVDCREFTLVWETRFISEDVWEISVTGFSQCGEGLYSKFSEVHRERVIPEREVLEALSKAGFKLSGSYDAFTMLPPDCGSSRRIFYVARKEEL